MERGERGDTEGEAVTRLSGAGWPAGGGEMGARIRAHDWAQTPLGPIEAWPPTLRTAAELLLAARQPVYVAWWPTLTSLYNDGYIPILGAKHPGGLGTPYADLFAEIWDEYRRSRRPCWRARRSTSSTGRRRSRGGGPTGR